MLKFNKTTEYGLLAISYIRSKPEGTLTSAREIAENFNLPFEILAKTLQRLKEKEIISSTHGTRGGYVMAADLKKLNLADFLNRMEGPMSVVACLGDVPEKTESCCEYNQKCSIKSPMGILNQQITDFLSRISVDELTRSALPSNSTTTDVKKMPGELGSVGSAFNATREKYAASPFQGEEP